MQLCTTVMNLFRPALAEISFDMHESRLSKTPQNQVSTSDGDKTFVIFGFELDDDHFQEKINLLNPALKFTVEREHMYCFCHQLER